MEAVSQPDQYSSTQSGSGNLDPHPGNTSSDVTESDKAESMLEEFRAHRNLAKLALQFNQVSQQRNYNQDCLNFEFEVGDSVLINPHSLNLLGADTGLGKKLLNKFDGPFEVTQKLGLATY